MKRFKLLQPGNRSLAVVGRYEKIYSIGSMVCDDETLGFILFDTIKNLISFVQMLCKHQETNYPSKFFVAEIDTIGDEVVPNELCSCVAREQYIDDFYRSGDYGYSPIPDGTICCKEIDVLDIQPLYQHLR